MFLRIAEEQVALPYGTVIKATRACRSTPRKVLKPGSPGSGHPRVAGPRHRRRRGSAHPQGRARPDRRPSAKSSPSARSARSGRSSPHVRPAKRRPAPTPADRGQDSEDGVDRLHAVRVRAGRRLGRGQEARDTASLTGGASSRSIPKVIPLGSKLFVEGYGYAVACDTGGAIHGQQHRRVLLGRRSRTRPTGERELRAEAAPRRRGSTTGAAGTACASRSSASRPWLIRRLPGTAPRAPCSQAHGLGLEEVAGPALPHRRQHRRQDPRSRAHARRRPRARDRSRGSARSPSLCATPPATSWRSSATPTCSPCSRRSRRCGNLSVRPRGRGAVDRWPSLDDAARAARWRSWPTCPTRVAATVVLAVLRGAALDRRARRSWSRPRSPTGWPPPPAARTYGSYTVKLRLHAVPPGASRCPRTCFMPPPRVDSRCCGSSASPRPEPPRAAGRGRHGSPTRRSPSGARRCATRSWLPPDGQASAFDDSAGGSGHRRAPEGRDAVRRRVRDLARSVRKSEPPVGLSRLIVRRPRPV